MDMAVFGQENLGGQRTRKMNRETRNLRIPDADVATAREIQTEVS